MTKPPNDERVANLAAQSRRLIDDAKRLCEATTRHLARVAKDAATHEGTTKTVEDDSDDKT